MQTQPIPMDERQKRQVVFTKKPTTILVKFLAHKPPAVLPKKEWNPAIVAAKQSALAEERKVDAHVYRADKIDTGLQIMNKEPEIRVESFLEELAATGYCYAGGHYQHREGKGPVTTTEFKLEGAAAEMPESVRQLFRLRWNNCTIWANLNSEGRLDTINLAKGLAEPGGRTLHLVGNTYHLE